jgi:hypothetical protein
VRRIDGPSWHKLPRFIGRKGRNGASILQRLTTIRCRAASTRLV